MRALDMSGENSLIYGINYSVEFIKKIRKVNKERLNYYALDEDRAIKIYYLYKDTDISLWELKEKYKHFIINFPGE